MCFTDENSSSGYGSQISKKFSQLLEINENDAKFCDTKISSSFDVNIPNTPDLQSLTRKEKPCLTGKNSSPGTDADTQIISSIQKQTEDAMSIANKNSSPCTDADRARTSEKKRRRTECC